MSVRKSSHGTIFLIVSSGSPRALIASSLRSTSKKPFCPMTAPSAHDRVRSPSQIRGDLARGIFRGALVSILVQKGVLTEQIVRAEWLGGLEEVVRATLDSPQATNPDEARASRIEIETLRQVVDWIWKRLFPSGNML